jgi:hypothetical protein
MNIFISFGMGNLSRFVVKQYIRFKFIESIPDARNNYYFLSGIKNEKRVDVLLNNKRIKQIIKIGDYFETNSWKESYQLIDKLVEEHKIDKVFVFVTRYNDSLNTSHDFDIEGAALYEKTLTDDSFMCKINVMKSFYKNILFYYYISKKLNIPLIHFIEDSKEIRFDQANSQNKNFFYYELQKYKADYFPYLEYGLIYGRPDCQTKKEYDFIFGMTALNDERHRIAVEFKNIQNSLKKDLKCELYFHDKKLDINTLINGNVYDEMLAKTKYTLVVPAYDKNEFSYPRIVESLCSKCIPLIHKNHPRETLITTMKEVPQFLEIIDKHNLYVEIDEIESKIKNLDYDSVISDFISCDDYQKYLKLEYYLKYFMKYRNIFGI